MKILHTHIFTEKVGYKFVAKCRFIPEKWRKNNPVEIELVGDTAEKAIAKAIDFLTSGGDDELEEVENFDKPNQPQNENTNNNRTTPYYCRVLGE